MRCQLMEQVRTLARVELAVDVGGKAVGDLADVRQAAGAAPAAHLVHENTAPHQTRRERQLSSWSFHRVAADES